MSCQQDLRPLIAAEAARQGVPAELALAIAQRESGGCHWNPNGSVKVGSAGEIGVMQVRPTTAPGVNLYDVNENIRAGVGYLAQMYQRFGDWTLAVQAYNCGPGCVASGRIPAITRQYAAAVVPASAPALPSAAGYVSVPDEIAEQFEGVAPVTAGVSDAGLAAVGLAALVIALLT